MFRQCLEQYHMKGLKWHPDNGYYPDSKEAYAVLEVANAAGVPLLTHCGLLPYSRAKYTHPSHLDDVAFDFPNIPVIAAHMGDMWWREWAALAKYKKNIYGDLAMWDLLAESQPSNFRRYLREILDIVGPEQVLFASDGPIFEPHVSKQHWVETIKGLTAPQTDGIRFSQSEVTAILGRNAARIFTL